MCKLPGMQIERERQAGREREREWSTTEWFCTVFACPFSTVCYWHPDGPAFGYCLLPKSDPNLQPVGGCCCIPLQPPLPLELLCCCWLWACAACSCLFACTLVSVCLSVRPSCSHSVAQCHQIAAAPRQMQALLGQHRSKNVSVIVCVLVWFQATLARNATQFEWVTVPVSVIVIVSVDVSSSLVACCRVKCFIFSFSSWKLHPSHRSGERQDKARRDEAQLCWRLRCFMLKLKGSFVAPPTHA